MGRVYNTAAASDKSSAGRNPILFITTKIVLSTTQHSTLKGRNPMKPSHGISK